MDAALLWMQLARLCEMNAKAIQFLSNVPALRQECDFLLQACWFCLRL